ncbi:hypothetical protein LX77_01309 [Gelidibacter algens]|jgi:hypothetical protein|uniref:Uncharacterized protein n=1 Tax=Gelidibacter algens TaxID=49280 RepID=A0A327SC27_9FLAO|nr:hypothetical protein [Gelidibacter algens]RAJ25892.1 hypothetical protein LX77_01309 [Gelidibacter algens]
MKRNIIGALVILLVTIAFLLVIDDISRAQDLPDHVNVHETN